MTASILSRLLQSKKSARVTTKSLTPILDLLEPLPRPADEIITGKFAFPFLTWIVIVVITQNYSFLVVLLGLLPALFLAVAIHECGHLVFGWCSGLRFRGVEIGPFCILRIRRKWSVRLRPRIYSGAAHMVLRRIRRIRRQLVICTLGGPVTSYGFALLAFIVGEVYRPTESSGWTTFVEFSGFLSLLIAVFSTFPYRTRIGGNDAYLLRQLFTSKSGSKQMIAAHAAHFAGNASPILPPYFERWWKLASANSEGVYSRFYVDWDTYSTAKDPAVSAGLLEQLLRQSSWYDVETRNFLKAEAAFFTARHRPGSGQGDVWLRRTRHLEWLNSLSRIRMDIAIAESRGEFGKALAACDSGLAMIRANLNSPFSFTMESEWVDWKRQIEARLTPANSDVLQLSNC
jgi:hypothetical protein